MSELNDFLEFWREKENDGFVFSFEALKFIFMKLVAQEIKDSGFDSSVVFEGDLVRCKQIGHDQFLMLLNGKQLDKIFEMIKKKRG